MARVLRAEKIICSCGSGEFNLVYELWRHPGKGMTPKLGGYKCLSCHEPLNMEEQARLADLKRQKAELDQVTQEIAEIEARNSLKDSLVESKTSRSGRKS